MDYDVPDGGLRLAGAHENLGKRVADINVVPCNARGWVVMPEDALAAIHAELNAFARRIRGSVSRLHPDLSFVAYTLLAHVEANGTCRAADLVAYYGLDKSTVSRQVAELERRGLLEPAPPARGARGQQLQVSTEGRERLARAAAQQR